MNSSLLPADASRRDLRRFTLIELLIVIAVIAILMAMLLPALSRAKESALMVVCANNLNQMHVANTVYAGDEDRYLMHSNWLNQEHYNDPDDFQFPGWLYDRRTVRRPWNSHLSSVETGHMYGYTSELDIFHCPKHVGWENGYGTQKLTSYMMNGVVNDYSYRHNQSAEKKRLLRISTAQPDGLLMTEQSEQSNRWNDGSNYPGELVHFWGTRHFERGTALSFDGRVEVFYQAEITHMARQSPGRLWCCPYHGNGR